MNVEDTADTLEIVDLEQDIGGMNAVEAAESRGSTDVIVTMFIPPR